MSPEQNIEVYHSEEERLNGLGMMISLAGEMALDQVWQVVDAAYNCLEGRLAA